MPTAARVAHEEFRGELGTKDSVLTRVSGLSTRQAPARLHSKKHEPMHSARADALIRSAVTAAAHYFDAFDAGSKITYSLLKDSCTSQVPLKPAGITNESPALKLH